MLCPQTRMTAILAAYEASGVAESQGTSVAAGAAAADAARPGSATSGPSGRAVTAENEDGRDLDDVEDDAGSEDSEPEMAEGDWGDDSRPSLQAVLGMAAAPQSSRRDQERAAKEGGQ